MTPEDRARLLKRYEEGYAAVLDAFAAIPEGAEDLAPRGEWSAREIVHHLADAELVQASRVRRLLAEEGPYLQAYDEQQFQQRLHYYRPVDASLALFKAALDSNVELLTLAFPEDWSRAGTHEELGDFSLETWLQRAADHPHEHAQQLRKLAGRG